MPGNHIIDWMIQLPKGLEPEFLQAVYAIEEEKKMPYINTAERLGLEKGLEKGRQEGLQEGRQEGQLEARQATARNLIKLGVLSDEQIVEATGLTVAEVQELRVDDRH
ncbi:hypothetical protein [Chromohalobacter nigrandesensis]|uniref:hypothetical protein n=1 Tax=Chromohalobacter nigrandesensis TaxID=119863 RepID=UPI001FF25DE2|nr:hypothetical protein [Chromohalobacter nigrandesensis]MCK0744890.1 hypothetical protein [Chromohalobacter nigrandesensis]